MYAIAQKSYRRRWEVWLRGVKLGEVLAATEQAACLRAIQRWKILEEDRSELNVRRAKDLQMQAREPH